MSDFNLMFNLGLALLVVYKAFIAKERIFMMYIIPIIVFVLLKYCNLFDFMSRNQKFIAIYTSFGIVFVIGLVHAIISVRRISNSE